MLQEARAEDVTAQDGSAADFGTKKDGMTGSLHSEWQVAHLLAEADKGANVGPSTFVAATSISTASNALSIEGVWSLHLENPYLAFFEH